MPEVVLENPDTLAQVHREFVRGGSDVVEAFTYSGHREKLLLIDKEDLLKLLNTAALDLAHAVAKEVRGEGHSWQATSATPTSITRTARPTAGSAPCSRSRSAGRSSAAPTSS